MNTVIDFNLLISLVIGAFVGSTAAYLGSLMVLKRLALVGDALTHIALPGMGIALTYSINPFIGAFAALLIGVILIWDIERRTTLPTEAVVGLIFSLSLAIGILVTPEPELLEALFGDISSVNLLDGVLAVIFSLLVLGAMYYIKDRLVLGLISPDFAKAQGVRLQALNLLFLIMVAIVVALGVKVIGTLLMGALVVIPAAASKNITRNLKSYGTMSAVLGVISAVAGIYLASAFNLSPGPIVVLASSSVFLFSLLFKKG